MTKRKDIGDPLEQTIATGKIGGQTSSSPTVNNLSSFSGSPAVQKSSSSKGNRVQQTIYLPTELAKWLKIQAIEEQREISAIATEALEMYRKLL